jgi:hypothetical protein
MAKKQPRPPGEPIEVELTPEQIRFLKIVAQPKLNAVPDEDTLKHFADVWWNLCQWEKQRADVLDTKAQSLVGLASIAGALIGLGAGALTPGWPSFFRVVAAITFLATVLFAIGALRVRQVAGFLDSDVFLALNATPVLKDTLGFKDDDPFRNYLRETVMQRWFIYDSLKTASAAKATRVKRAQYLAGASVFFVIVFMLVAYGSLPSIQQSVLEAIQKITIMH